MGQTTKLFFPWFSSFFPCFSLILHDAQGAFTAQHASCEHLECKLTQNCVGCKVSLDDVMCWFKTSFGFGLRFILGWFKVHFGLVQDFFKGLFRVS